MKVIYSAPVAAPVYHAKNVLEHHEIDCLVKGEYLSGAAGVIPFTETWIELYVVDDSKFDEARHILGEALGRKAGNALPKQCGRCGAEIDGPFTECWNCGAALESTV